MITLNERVYNALTVVSGTKSPFADENRELEKKLRVIFESESGGEEFPVSGRALHDFLDVNERFNDWIPRMLEYGFIEGQDFYSKISKSTGGRPARDYWISLNMAKQIAMIQRTNLGRLVREYLIWAEGQYRKEHQPSYEIHDPIERAKRWIQEQEAHKALIKKKDTEILELNTQLEEQEPLVQLGSAISRNDGEQTIQDFGRAMIAAGIKNLYVPNRIKNGPNNIYRWLTYRKYIFKRGNDYRAMAEYVQQGLFRNSTGPLETCSFSRLSNTVLVTGKGFEKLYSILRQEEDNNE